MNKTIIGTMIAILTIIGAVMALTSGNVSQAEFQTYKAEKVRLEDRLDQRLERMEEKIDKIAEKIK